MSDRPPSADAAWVAVRWGALWGPVGGFWFLAPRLLESHRLYPETVTQWLVLVLALTVLFCGIGSVLGFISGLVLVAAQSVRRRSTRHLEWFLALSLGPVMTVVYLSDSLLVHWLSFGSFGALRQDRGLILGLSAIGAIAVLLTITYKRIASFARAPSLSALATVLGITLLAGGGVLPLRIGIPPLPATAGATTISCAPGPANPLVLLGVDSGTWRIIDPLLERGSLPNLKRLLDGGMHGDVDALWPPHWSGAAWGAILTGYPRDETGVFEDMAARAPHLPPFQVPLTADLLLNPLLGIRSLLDTTGIIDFTPPPRALLRRQPFWELLDQADVPTAVVRFRFTYPAQSRTGVVVSDWIGRDQWNLMLRADPVATEPLVAPAELARYLSSPFSADSEIDEALVQELLPVPVPDTPADAKIHPVEMLRLASDIDRRTFDVSEAIVQHRPDIGVLAVYIGGPDTVAHASWQYRFPEDFPGAEPATRDIERLGPVLDRYMQFVDRRLGDLVARYDRPPTYSLSPTTAMQP